MKIIVAGSRKAEDGELVSELIKFAPFHISTVVSGGAPGIDRLGEHWALKRGIPLFRSLAKWEEFGDKAGPIRNKLMAEIADGLILIWDGKSRGSKSMYEIAKRLRLPYVSYVVRGVSNPCPGYRLYKIHKEQNLYSYFSQGTNKPLVDELHVLVPTCSPTS